MTALARRYRVRFAVRGVDDVEGNVAFTLGLSDLHGIPAVAGSFAHPLDGATEVRPFTVESVDLDGSLIAAFAEDGRWAALGRLADVQYQEASEDPDADPWFTYGTGRCSGLDEMDGPGKFRVQLADEGWVARRRTIFNEAGTASIWPCGVRETWRGFRRSQRGRGAGLTNTGVLHRIRIAAGEFGSLEDVRGREVIDPVVDWIKGDIKPVTERVFATDATVGNFRHLRLNYPDTVGNVLDWEMLSFGVDPLDEASVFESLEDPEVLDTSAGAGGGTGDPDGEAAGIGREVRLYVWVVGRPAPFAIPAFTGEAYLYAPTAPPDEVNPLHVGLGDPDHPWGTGETAGQAPLSGVGWIHVADMTRRVWTALGLRFDPTNLDALELDESFPPLAPRITEFPQDPEAWMQANVWGPLMLLALKDARGRRKLVDLRPPSDETDLDVLPTLDATNTAGHRWRLDNRELMNSVRWDYLELKEPEEPYVSIEEVESVDNLRVRELRLDPFDSDNIALVGRRERVFRGFAGEIDPDTPAVRIASGFASGIGPPFSEIVPGHSALLLGIYQDGPIRGSATIGRALAETLAEGSYILVDLDSLKGANPLTEARTGLQLALVLSLTRYPSHADIEYLVVRPGTAVGPFVNPCVESV